jgi:hypothetical protein
MPSNINLFRKHNYNKVFVETGSYDGDGIKNAIFSGYKNIYSIELAEKYYYLCKNYFLYNENVHLSLGDSVKELPTILSQINEPTTFWLDAHYSGGDTDFANVLSPLMTEIDIIGSHPIKEHTILIDDMREWQVSYPAIRFGIEELKNKILSINPNYVFSLTDGHVANDILVAEIRKDKPINIIVFSRDRAMQLELFLRSFKECVKESGHYNIKVLYTCSTDAYKQGYDKLISMAYNVEFVNEGNFKLNTIYLIDPNKPHTVFFVDDDVFKEPIDFYDSQMDVFNGDESIACRSLRLSRYLEYCYTLQKPMRQPEYGNNNIFNWSTSSLDFGYPMSLDGHIFRTKEILPHLKDLVYSNPNTLESVMVGVRNKFGKNMVCYNKSPIFNIPINRVQTVNQNICGHIGAEELNTLFLNGKVIDLVPIMGILNKSCHQEVNLTYKDQ